MGRTILEIAQEAAERRGTAPAPAQLFDTNNKVSRILRTAAHDTMRDYLRSTNWTGVSEFHSTWVFSLFPNRFAYPLPPDYLRSIPGTEQRNGWPLGLLGPATPQTWSRWLSGVAAVVAPMGWRIKNGNIFIEPPPAREELVMIEYVSRYPVVSDIADGDYNFATSPPTANAPVVPRDGHLSAFDTSLLSQSRSDVGKYDEEPGYDVATWADEPADILRRANPLATTGFLPQVRREKFTADSDRPAFDDDHILSLGMTSRLRQAFGLDYAMDFADYEAEKEAKISADAGGARTFRVGCDHAEYDTLPLGNGQWLLS